MECKDRNNRSAIMLPYSFLPSMAAEKLRDASEKVHLIHNLFLVFFIEVDNFHRQKELNIKYIFFYE